MERGRGMPNTVKQIKEAMRKQGIPEEMTARFDFPETNQPEVIFALIDQMDKWLSKEQRLSIMEKQGCCTAGKPAAAHRAFGRKHAGKTVEKRIKLLDELNTTHNPPCRLNDDGTLSVFWENGEEGAYQCVCGYVRKLTRPVPVSPTFCGCCGGHARQNLQRSLGVNLRLKEIVSSAISTQGEKRCEFLYEISGK